MPESSLKSMGKCSLTAKREICSTPQFIPFFIFPLFLLKAFLPCCLPFASTAGPAEELYKINLLFQSSALFLTELLICI